MNMNAAEDSEQVTLWAQAREKLGLSLEEISDRTHIPVRKLRAIEEGQYGDLGGATFALGYIRAYAKNIEFDAQVIVDSFKDSAGGEGPRSEKSETKVASSTKSKISVLYVSIVAIVIWAAFMAFWPSSDEGATESVPSDTQTPTSQVEPSVQEEQENSIEETQQQEAPSLDTAVSAESPQQEEPEIAETVQTGADPIPQEQLEPLPQATVTQPEVTSFVTQEAQQADLEPQVAEVTTGDEASSSDEDLLIFTFSDDCWVEVRDAQGKVLIAELKRKEDNLQIFGQAPFSVMLGNARVVTLTMNGRAVSTQPPGNNKTMRMTVSR